MSEVNRKVMISDIDFFPADIQQDIGKVVATLKTLTTEQPPLGEALHHVLIRSKGKLLRPSLLLLAGRFQCSMTPQSSWNERDLIDTAASVELLHTATLIHDDVIDGVKTRRGNPTINELYGDQFAILLADFSYAQSLKFALKTQQIESLTIFAQTAINIVKSEILSRVPISLTEPVDFKTLIAQYFEMIDWRTAGLFAACCHMGSLLAGGTESQIKRLSQFGLYLGRSFQIVDDILDFVGSEPQLGKPIGSDLRNGVLTLPMILALKHGRRKSRLWKILGKPTLDADAVREGIQDVKESGGVKLAYETAQKWKDKAKLALHGLPVNGYKNALESLAEYIVQRLK